MKYISLNTIANLMVIVFIILLFLSIYQYGISITIHKSTFHLSIECTPLKYLL
jgi:hypothetical protein